MAFWWNDHLMAYAMLFNSSYLRVAREKYSHFFVCEFFCFSHAMLVITCVLTMLAIDIVYFSLKFNTEMKLISVWMIIGLYHVS